MNATDSPINRMRGALLRHANRRYPAFGAREARQQGGYWRLINERGTCNTLMELDDLCAAPKEVA